MTEIVWVALISAGGALAAAFMTQILATSAATKQATHTAQQEALQWSRSEAKRLSELHEARLRELWAHVLRAQNLIRDELDLRTSGVSPQAPRPAESGSAASAAAQAYCVALIGLHGVRPLAKDFYQATAKAEMAIRYEKTLGADVVSAWREALNQLEAAVSVESASLQVSLV